MARVVIIGGGVIGAAVAYFLSRRPGCAITVIERDPSYARASTALSASGIRHQFSSAVNIQICQFGTEFLRGFTHPDGAGMSLREQGYLFLAASPAQAAHLRDIHALQRRLGADVALLDPKALATRFPHLNTDDLALGSLGLSGEGWFDNIGLLHAFRAHARAAGAVFVQAEATGITLAGGRVMAVRLDTGAVLPCDWAVNAAGPNAARVAAWAGIDLAVEPRKRTVFHIVPQDPVPPGLPLMIDPSGIWCRPEGAGFICGCAPEPDGPADPADFDPCHEEFEDRVWPVLAARAPLFEAVKVRNLWAGHYDWNRLDQNAILGPHPQLPNLIFANGFSGHGLQQAPAVGRGVAEWITTGGWASLDLGPLGWDRVLSGTPNVEHAVV